MTEIHPDDPQFHTSPLSTDALSAIGQLITCWGAIEAGLPLQVGRLIATHPVNGKMMFDHATFAKACIVGGGTSARAALQQIVNLLSMHGDRYEEAKAYSKILLNKKDQRDEVTHRMAIPSGDESIHLRTYGASRSKMFSETVRTVEEIRSWTTEIKAAARGLDTLISEATTWNWKRIDELREQWLATQDPKDEEYAGILHPFQ